MFREFNKKVKVRETNRSENEMFRRVQNTNFCESRQILLHSCRIELTYQLSSKYNKNNKDKNAKRNNCNNNDQITK